MKNIITFILVSLFVSTITAQTLSVGNWKAGWQVNTATCCVPSQISISSTNNSVYTASFTFPSNYTTTNTYCASNNITGNFITNITLSSTSSSPFYSGVETTNVWTSNLSIAFTSATDYSVLFGETFGPYFSVYMTNCSYGILPPGSSSYSSQDYLNQSGNYSTVVSTLGWNASNATNETVNTCCIPSSVSIGFINNSSQLNLSATFSPSALNNSWCIGGNVTNPTITNQYYTPTLYTSNQTIWSSETSVFEIIMGTNTSSGFITGSFYGINNSVCSFNMTLTNFGAKLAASLSIISLLIIALW